MINQEINILLLELKDSLTKEKIYIDKNKFESDMINDFQLMELIKKYSAYNEQLENISYTSAVKDILNAQLKIEQELNSYDTYKIYNDKYVLCNERLKYISSIVYQDILKINERICGGGCNESS